MSYQEGTEAMKTPGSPASSQPATPGLPIQLLPDRPELVVSTNQDPSNSTTPLEPLSPASPTYSEPYSPGFTTHSRPETSGQPKTSRSDLEPKPARCFTRSTVFSIEREAYNYTSLDAALIQMFRAPSDLDLDNAEALEYTLSTEPVGRRSAEVHDPSFDTVSGVALKTAIDNIVNESIANGKTDNWLECAEFGGFWSEETAESDSKVEPSEKVKIRVV
ncbi:hypothetical protein BJ508DRAFT_137995 [Ascobolus immersus RN42]|uniref:Uncharacterized protein n=1 Tax=Ascobolus immersus RN42 TaxID=1160509 RepID=A0A3N4I4W5_ASCIM|nr:hypothetical protein BJ508DRAFT_137995 [Ascobolus immersus RN42]